MASNFLKAKDVLEGVEYMKNINYKDLNDNNKEFIRGDVWEAEFIVPPRAVYFPGNKIIQTRLAKFTPTIPGAINAIDKTIRGFQISQATHKETHGTLSMEFIDREDQAISIFMDDWGQKISDRDTKYSFRKEDWVAQIGYVMFNSSRVPIRKLTFFGVQPDDNTLKFDGGDPGDDNSDLTLSLKFEHHELEFLNIQ